MNKLISVELQPKTVLFLNTTILVILLTLHFTLPYGFFKIDVDKSMSELYEVTIIVLSAYFCIKILSILDTSRVFIFLGYFLLFVAFDNFFSVHEQFGIVLNNSDIVQKLSEDTGIWDQAISEITFFIGFGLLSLLILIPPFIRSNIHSKKIFIFIAVGISIASFGGAFFDFAREVESLHLNFKDAGFLEDFIELIGFISIFQITYYQSFLNKDS